MRVALIGQGFMGKAHSNALAQVGRFFDLPSPLELRVICGRDRNVLEKNARSWGWQEIATDWRSVVERKDVDIVDIAVPNNLHAEVAIAALEAGKIVLCEKPLANSLEDARSMAKAAKGKSTMVWFNYRRAPAVAFAKQLIDQGRIGQVFHYRGSYQQQWGPDKSRPVNWKMDPQHAGHGVVGDLLSHVADMALYLNGGVDRLSALTRIFMPGRNVEDAAMAMVQFQNGSIGMFESTRYAVGSLNRNRFEIQGLAGSLRFNLEDMNRLEFFDATESPSLQAFRNILVTGAQHPYGSNFWKPGHIIGYEHTFIAALADFLIAQAAGEEFHPNFEDGLRVQEVLEAVVKSAESGQWERTGL